MKRDQIAQELALMSWLDLWTKFTGETTFHGVRYLGEVTPFILRRLIWLVLVCGAVGTFIAMFYLRVDHLRSNPTGVNVEVIYNGSMDFPAVTICNQNLFRISTAHKSGMYDRINNTFREIENTALPAAPQADDEGFDVIHNVYLRGIGKAYVKYGNITASVCQHLCINVDSDVCCSLVYFQATSSCYISPLEAREGDTRITLEEAEYVDYYRWKKCKFQEEAFCDFDSGDTFCKFVQDKKQVFQWKHQQASSARANMPTVDATTLTSAGSYLIAKTQYDQADVSAELLSPYLISTTYTCIYFKYQIEKGILQLRVGTSQEGFETVWKMVPVKSDDWESGWYQMTKEYYRVKFRAMAGADKQVNIALDNIYIGPCKPAPSCKTTPIGLGYRGDQNVTRSGKTCDHWYKLGDNILLSSWRFGSGDVMKEENYCRNPDADIHGPWCFTDTAAGSVEYCDILMCKCDGIPNMFRCGNGQCISSRLKCNEEKDCEDGSDELECGWVYRKVYENEPESSVNCTFTGPTSCGYVSWGEYMTEWRPIAGENGENYMHLVKNPYARPGAHARLISPPVITSGPSCLKLDVQMQGVSIDLYGVDRPDSLHKTYMCTIVSEPKIPAGMWSTVQIDMDPWNTVPTTPEPEEEEDVGNATTTSPYNITSLSFANGTMENSHDPLMFTEEWVDSVVKTTTTRKPPSPKRWFIVIEALVEANPFVLRLDELEFYDGYCVEEYETTEGPPTTEPPPTTTPYMEPTTTEEPFTLVSTAQPLVDTNSTLLPPDPDDTLNRTRRDLNGTLDGTDLMGNETFENGTLGNETWGNGTWGNGTTEAEEWWDVTTLPPITTTEAIPVPTCKAYVPPKREVVGNGTFEEEIGYFPAYGSQCPTCTKKLMTIDESVCNSPKKGISCNFNNCSCGYVYQTSSNTIQWIMSEEGHAEMIGKPMSSDAALLISPVETIKNTSCLILSYWKSQVDVTVFTYDDVGMTELVTVNVDGTSAAWHTAKLTIKPGTYGLAIDMYYGSAQGQEHEGKIDDIYILPGHCRDLELSQEVSVNCTFQDKYWCGYRDLYNDTVEPAQWYRTQEYESHVRAFYVKVQHPNSGGLKGEQKLLSPPFSIYDYSCLEFYWYMQGTAKTELAYLSATLLPENANEASLTVWRVRTISDNEFHYGRADIPPGSWRLLFGIYSAAYRGGVDDILILPGACEDSTDNVTYCAEGEFKCTENFACMASSVECDGIANCYAGEDEFNCTTAGDEESDKDNNGGGGSDEVVDYASTELLVQKEEFTNLSDMYRALGHQKEDMITRCTWEGRECQGEQLDWKVTDYGSCYTFNSDPLNTTTTAKTGSRFGLSLTVNIEQYEYMTGPNSDAGLKVFLHPTDEIPQVRDLGFAVAPGTHSLVGVMRSSASNLESPWGECAEPVYTHPVGLPSSEYKLSACELQCETRKLNATCGCRDVYMPGRHASDPYCSVDKWFDCAVPFLNSVQPAEPVNDTCTDCPKPCVQILYEPMLSYATLSALSVDKLLKEKDKLLGKYENALESAGRTDGELFTKNIELFQKLSSNYEEIQLFLVTYLAEKDQSKIAKLWKATQVMVVDIFLQDMNALLGATDRMLDLYNQSYLNTRQLLEADMEQLLSDLKDIDQLLYMSVLQSSRHSSLGNKVSQTRQLCLDVKESLDFWNIIVDNQTLALQWAGKSLDNETRLLLPVKMYVNVPDCKKKIDSFMAVAGTMERFLYSEVSFGAIDLSRNKQFRQNVSSFTTLANQVRACLNEYPMTLKDVIAGRNAHRVYAQQINLPKAVVNTETFVYETQAALLAEWKKKSDDALSKYTLGHIGKREYLQSLSAASGQDLAITNLDTFIARIENIVSTPLKIEIIDVQDKLLVAYEDTMYHAVRLSPYVSDTYLYDISGKMRIWKTPEANLLRPDQISDLGKELWHIWNRDLPIKDFVNQGKSSDAIKTGLNTYFKTLYDDLDSFESQLTRHQNNIKTSINNIRDAAAAYMQQLTVKGAFIRDNFLVLDVYFKQLKFQQVEQIKTYGPSAFLGEIGGYMGLLIGGSALSIIEILDFFVFNCINKMVVRRRNYRVNRSSNGHDATTASNGEPRKTHNFESNNGNHNNSAGDVMYGGRNGGGRYADVGGGGVGTFTGGLDNHGYTTGSSVMVGGPRGAEGGAAGGSSYGKHYAI